MIWNRPIALNPLKYYLESHKLLYRMFHLGNDEWICILALPSITFSVTTLVVVVCVIQTRGVLESSHRALSIGTTFKSDHVTLVLKFTLSLISWLVVEVGR